MAIPPIPPVTGAESAAAAQAPKFNPPQEASFGEILSEGLQQVSDLEKAADSTAESFAVGEAKPHEVMTSMTQSKLATDMLGSVRDKGLAAYREIMRMRV